MAHKAFIVAVISYLARFAVAAPWSTLVKCRFAYQLGDLSSHEITQPKRDLHNDYSRPPAGEINRSDPRLYVSCTNTNAHKKALVANPSRKGVRRPRTRQARQARTALKRVIQAEALSVQRHQTGRKKVIQREALRVQLDRKYRKRANRRAAPRIQPAQMRRVEVVEIQA